MTFFKEPGIDFNHFAFFRCIFKPEILVLREKLSRLKKKIIKIGPELAILSNVLLFGPASRTTLRTRLQPLISGVKIDGFRRIFFPNGLKFPEEFENRVEKFIRATF